MFRSALRMMKSKASVVRDIARRVGGEPVLQADCLPDGAAVVFVVTWLALMWGA